MSKTDRMQMGELSRLSGVPYYTIHYYIKQGILHPPERLGKTRAYYDQTHLDRLMVIQEMKQKYGYPLSYIKRHLNMENMVESHTNQVNWEATDTAKPRGGQKKKGLILDAAIELYSSQGYHHTSIKDIANHLGISTGSIYVYFQSKKDLFIQAVIRAVRFTLSEVEQVIDEEEDFYSRTRLRIEALHDRYSLFSEIFTQLRAEAVTSNTWAKNMVDQIFMEFINPLVREIQQVIDQGDLAPVDPELLACCMIGTVDMLLYRETMDKKYSTQDISEFLFSLFETSLPKRQT